MTPLPRLLMQFVRAGLAVPALLCATVVGAEEVSHEVSGFRFSGFGTLSRSWDNNDRMELIRDVTQRPMDNGFNSSGSWKLDSRLGLQFAYRFSPNLEAVAQVVARSQHSEEFHHYVDLAYLDIQSIPEARIRLGRVGYDAFLMSDHRNLGYAYAWMRPPVEFYSWIPIFGLNGGDITHEFQHGDAIWRLRAQAGQSDIVMPMGTDKFNFHADSLWSLSLQRSAGPWRLKASMSGFTSGAEIEMPIAPLHAGLRDVAQQTRNLFPAISREAEYMLDETSFKNIRLRYYGVGAAYDDGTWFGQAEASVLRTGNNIIPQTSNAYAVLGRRIGTWSPFLMFGISRPDRKLAKPLNDWTILGANAVNLQTTTYQRILDSSRFDQETFSVGTRWDFHSQAALKLQFDHTRIHPHGYAAYFRDFPEMFRSNNINMLSVGVDFVF